MADAAVITTSRPGPGQMLGLADDIVSSVAGAASGVVTEARSDYASLMAELSTLETLLKVAIGVNAAMLLVLLLGRRS